MSTLGKRTRASARLAQHASEDLDALTEQLPAKRMRSTASKTSAVVGPSENNENVPPTSTRSSRKRAAAVASDTADRTAPVQPPIRSVSESPSKPRFNPVTPTTKRYRDVSASPSTPRTVVMSAGRLFKRMTPQTPRIAKPTGTPGSEKSSASCTPGTPVYKSVYHDVRQLFARGSDPGQLIGRDTEKKEIDEFLARCHGDKTNGKKMGGCLYVSGPPGTGKSAMCTELSAAMARKQGIQHAFINCMSIKSSRDLYIQLLIKLGDDESVVLGNDPVEALAQRFLAKDGPTYLVVLDEIDHVLTMGMESLPRLFEWSLQRPTRLVLIGIANALDLTDRFLPRLKAKGLKPDLLPFLPYTAPQIKAIILTRLKSLVPADATNPNWVPFIHPAAIELCSRKIASQTGDLRKAFEVVRRSLDLIEMDVRKQYEEEAKEALASMSASRKPLGETANNAAVLRHTAATGFPSAAAQSVHVSVKNSMEALTAITAPRVSISHLNKVTAAAFSHGTSQRMRTLNLQQKAALCALIALERRNRARIDVYSSSGSASGASTPAGLTTPSKHAARESISAPTIKTLYDAYAKLCTRDSVLHPLSSSEFREVVGSLETLGLVQPVDGRTGGLVAGIGAVTPSKRGRRTGFLPAGEDKRVASCVGEAEAEQAAEGVGAGILRSILSGEALEE
ncbi:Cell division control protein 18 [Ceratocystis fimbriata CBS 114723]|uniref:Cell division control protein n=1 Tax=Ceratocystis fimbriata CBS 114723 TaxID=1035309 RepID=A0A2C5X529_9PEZI|nr:Cell division control protein 18 [Ceratocystis fimbriata CBS 114723]